MCSKNWARKPNGFTLIELLVVIAIVAVIAAILFPVFAEVRERGRRTVCQSNLGQLALAVQQYVQDNDGTYPPNLDWGYAPFSYLKNVDVFRCPDHPSDLIFGTFTTEAPVVSADQHKMWEGK
jgi:prepilin-type N-terminal cleavage/methylation domain-containing protein